MSLAPLSARALLPWLLITMAECQPAHCLEGQACDAESDASALLARRAVPAQKPATNPSRPVAGAVHSLFKPDSNLLVWDDVSRLDVLERVIDDDQNYFLNGWLKVPLSHEEAREQPEGKPIHACLRVSAVAKENNTLGAMLLHSGGPGNDRTAAGGPGSGFAPGFDLVGIDQRGVRTHFDIGPRRSLWLMDGEDWEDCPFKESDGRPVRPFPKVACDEIYKQLSNGMNESANSSERYEWQVKRAKEMLKDFEPSDADIRIVFAILREGLGFSNGKHGNTYLYEDYVRWGYRLFQLEAAMCTSADRYNSWESESGFKYNLFEYVGTEDLLQDLDILRRAIGQDRLSFYGWSYGTIVASAFATVFPNRTDRVVLDGVLPPLLTAEGIAATQLRGHSSVYQAVFTDCSNSLYRGNSSAQRCPLAPAPSTKVEEMIRDRENIVRASAVDRMFNSLARECNAGNCIGHSALALRCAAALHGGADPDELPELCRDFTEEVLHPPADDEPLEPMDDRLFPTIAAAVLALDAPGRYGEEAVVELWKEQVNKYPLAVKVYILCLIPLVSWPAYSKPLPPLGQGHTRALIIGNLHDQATDYYGAQAMRQAFPSGAILTYQGFGHCLPTRPAVDPASASEQALKTHLSLNHCNNIVLDYIKTMELPMDGYTCKIYGSLSSAPPVAPPPPAGSGTEDTDRSPEDSLQQ